MRLHRVQARVLKVFGQHFENSSVGDYRIWMPFRALNELKLAECRRLPDDLTHVAMSLQRDHPRYDPSVGSYEEMGRWANVCVFQRMGNLMELAIALAMRHEYDNALIGEIDDNLFAVPSTYAVYKAYRSRAPGEGMEYTPVPAGQESVFRRRKDGMLITGKKGELLFATKTSMTIREVVQEFLKEVDAVTTTTEYLATVFRNFNAHVYVLPNCLETARWKKVPPPRPHPDEIRMGWFGGSQHYEDLSLLERVVPNLLRRYPNLVWVMPMAVPDFWRECVEKAERGFRLIPFTSVQKWPEYLGEQGIDIAVTPLKDNPFNRSKSNIKLLEFGALGIPGVFSAVGPYLEVQHDVNGLLAKNTDDEWMGRLSELIEDVGKRRRLGAEAQKYVFANYEIRDKAHLWAECYNEVWERTRRIKRR